MTIIDSQVHAYEANTPKRPWNSVPNWPDHVTGDEMVAAMDKVGVDGAIFISAFSMYRYDDWRFLEERFGAVYTDKPGQPPLPTRLMAGLAILKHTYDLSDEALCDRWVESPYFQYFCGEEFFQHALVFDRSSLTRWRQRMGEDELQALLQESLAVATRTEAMKPSDLARVVIDHHGAAEGDLALRLNDLLPAPPRRVPGARGPARTRSETGRLLRLQNPLRWG
jgi:Transposase domain (DUF772)